MMGLKNKLFSRRSDTSHLTVGVSPEGPLDMASIRIIQRNLVYAKNIPASMATEKKLTQPEFFGKYGSIAKCILVPSNEASSIHYKAYITFETAEEAAKCISACHKLKIGSSVLEVTLGTTRYCNYFINKTPCPRKGCFFLHERMPEWELNRTESGNIENGKGNRKNEEEESQKCTRSEVHMKKEQTRIGNETKTQTKPKSRTREDLITDSKIEKEKAKETGKENDLLEEENLKQTQTQRPTEKERGRTQSRFSFAQGGNHNQMNNANVQELVHIASPSKQSAQINQYEYELIMNSLQPEAWATDIIKTVRDEFNKGSQEIYLISARK